MIALGEFVDRRMTSTDTAAAVSVLDFTGRFSPSVDGPSALSLDKRLEIFIHRSHLKRTCVHAAHR